MLERAKMNSCPTPMTEAITPWTFLGRKPISGHDREEGGRRERTVRRDQLSLVDGAVIGLGGDGLLAVPIEAYRWHDRSTPRLKPGWCALRVRVRSDQLPLAVAGHGREFLARPVEHEDFRLALHGAAVHEARGKDDPLLGVEASQRVLGALDRTKVQSLRVGCS